MRALVTGATGFIGYELVRRLVEAGQRPRALVRRVARGALLDPLDVEPVVGDLGSPASLRRACEGVDTVFHLAARATFERTDRLTETLVGGSAALVEAAAEAGVRRIVYSSSLLVYPSQEEGRLIGRATPAAPAVDYGRVKVSAERVLTRGCAAAGIELAAVRLPHVYGARDLMFASFHRRVSVLPGFPPVAYAHLHVRDAARLLHAIAEQGWVGVAPCGDDSNADWDRFLQIVRRYLPAHHMVRLPALPAVAALRLAEPLVRLLPTPTMIAPDTVRSTALQLPVEPGVLWDDLGLTPTYPTPEQGIPAALDELVAWRWRHPVKDRCS